MFKAIITFIKAHTIATAITAGIVVSTAVATPIVINKVQKNNQEKNIEQIQENIIDNTEVNEISETTEENTTEENTTDENITDENTTDEDTTGDNITDENTNKQTTQNTSNMGNEKKQETENKGTWTTVIPVDTEQGFCGFQYNSKTKKYRVLLTDGYGAEFTKAQAMTQPDVAGIITQYKYMIESSQKQLVSIHNRYEEYRANAQKEIDKRKDKITTYKNAVISEGGDLKSDVVKKSLAEYNEDLQRAIDYKASFDKNEEDESRTLKKLLQNSQSKLNVILAQFQ